MNPALTTESIQGQNTCEESITHRCQLKSTLFQPSIFITLQYMQGQVCYVLLISHNIIHGSVATVVLSKLPSCHQLAVVQITCNSLVDSKVAINESTCKQEDRNQGASFGLMIASGMCFGGWSPTLMGNTQCWVHLQG